MKFLQASFSAEVLFCFKFYLFLEKGREGEREGEKHRCVIASHVAPTGDLACNPGMCPDWELTWQPFGSQTGTRSIEPHQPGHILEFLVKIPRHLMGIIKTATTTTSGTNGRDRLSQKVMGNFGLPSEATHEVHKEDSSLLLESSNVFN